MFSKRRGRLLKMEKDGQEIESDRGSVRNFFKSLPEGFVANVLALTSPRDVCRLSLVCPVFRSAAEWGCVWEKFLPPDYRKILRSCSKKEMYLRLCDHPVIIDGGSKSFSLDKCTGKKCYMLAARDLTIVWGDTPRYWRWISLPESRSPIHLRTSLYTFSFPVPQNNLFTIFISGPETEVAELRNACWLEVHGKINTSMLSTNTQYVSYLVYKCRSVTFGLKRQPVEVSIGINGVESQTKIVFFDYEALQRIERNAFAERRYWIFYELGLLNLPKERQDGWWEVELGEYFCERGKEGELKISLMEVKGGNWKGAIVIQGIEIRPKPY